MLHGWPGLRGRDLIALANATITGGPTPPVHYSKREFPDQDVLARHPYDEQVWLAGIGAVAELPAGVDAVVSLCRVPEAPDVTDFIEVWLIDEADPASNVNLDFVLDDTVAIVRATPHPRTHRSAALRASAEPNPHRRRPVRHETARCAGRHRARRRAGRLARRLPQLGIPRRAGASRKTGLLPIRTVEMTSAECHLTDGRCSSYRAGHLAHWIQAKLVGRTPWGWRDGIVEECGGHTVRIRYLTQDATVVCWHHNDLSRQLRPGAPVRLHEEFHMLAIPRAWICVLVTDGLGRVPTPDNPELWNSEIVPGIVDLATGIGLPTDDPSGGRSALGPPGSAPA